MFWSAESEHPRLTNGEIISDVFQPMCSQSTNVTDGRTDRQTTCDSNTALCTKVHRAVKTGSLAHSGYTFPITIPALALEVQFLAFALA